MNEKQFRTKREILGVFAKWIVRQMPRVPGEIIDISPFLFEVELRMEPLDSADDVVSFFNETDMKEWIWDVCKFSKIAELNKSKAEKEGKPVSEYVFVDRYTKVKPEYDFVDLDALARNIQNELIETANL